MHWPGLNGKFGISNSESFGSPHIKVQNSLALSFVRGRVLPLKLPAGSMVLPVVTHNVI